VGVFRYNEGFRDKKKIREGKRGKREFLYAIKSRVYNGGGNDDKLLYILEPSWFRSVASDLSSHRRVPTQPQSVLTQVSSTEGFFKL